MVSASLRLNPSYITPFKCWHNTITHATKFWHDTIIHTTFLKSHITSSYVPLLNYITSSYVPLSTYTVTSPYAPLSILVKPHPTHLLSNCPFFSDISIYFFSCLSQPSSKMSSCSSSKWPYLFCWGMIFKAIICGKGVPASVSTLAARTKFVCLCVHRHIIISVDYTVIKITIWFFWEQTQT